MIRWLVLSLALLVGPALATPKPFRAEYEAWVDGTLSGDAVLELRAGQDHTWEFRTTARGTRGLAKLAGVRSEHRAWLDSKLATPRLLAAHTRLHTRWRDRSLDLKIDWDARTVRWEGELPKDAPPRQPLPMNAVPATGASLNLMLGLAAQGVETGAELTYALLERGRQRIVRYRALMPERIEVPAGRFVAVPMRQDDPARSRTITAWFAQGLPPTPIRVMQTESGKARYELRLRRILVDTQAQASP